MKRQKYEASKSINSKEKKKKPKGEHMHLKDEEERDKVMEGRDRACK